MKRAEFKWGRLSKRQRRVLNWWAPKSKVRNYDGIIADGSIRSGKTVSMGFSFVVWAMSTYDGHNFGLCGKTIGALRRNVISTLKQQLRSRGYSVQDRRSDNYLVVSKGEQANVFYMFGGKDERSQDLVQGVTLAGVFFDEVALMPESFVNQATARCSVAGSKFWFNCNPASPQHWFYQNWVRRCRSKHLLYIHFTMDDNLTLAEEIKERYKHQWTGVFYQRYILGMWVAAEGLVYPAFDKARHVTQDVPEDGIWYVSCDYGTMNPFSAGLWCVSGGCAIRAAEYYYSGRAQHQQQTDEEYYSALVELIDGRSIQEIVVDPSAASFIAVIRQHGAYRVRKANNSVLDGIRYTARLLSAGKLRFHAQCKDIIAEFGAYSWDEKSGEDRVIKENDHAMDDMRYFCMTVLRGVYRW